jgi:hypothetical protein
MSPTDSDARIAKMKDGSTHLAHKAERAVVMESAAVIAVTLRAASQGGTATVHQTRCTSAIHDRPQRTDAMLIISLMRSPRRSA